MDDKDRKLPPHAGASRARAAANRVPLSAAALSPVVRDSPVQEFYNQLLLETKLISQLLAYSWLSDEEAADIPPSHLPTPLQGKEVQPSEIADTLQYEGSREIKNLIEDLVGVDLNVWFGSSSEVCVSWDKFDAVIHEGGDAAVAAKDLRYTIYLPYPPRPQCATSLELANWIADKDDKHLGPPYPYIPLSGAG